MFGRSSGGSGRPGARTGEEAGLVSGRSSGGSGRPGARTGEGAGLVSGRSLGDLGGGDFIHEVALIVALSALFAVCCNA